MQLKPEAARRLEQIAGFDLRKRTGRIDDQGEDGCGRHQLVEEFEPLRSDLSRQVGDPRDIAAGPVEAGDQPKLHRVGADLEDYWDRSG